MLGCEVEHPFFILLNVYSVIVLSTVKLPDTPELLL